MMLSKVMTAAMTLAIGVALRVPAFALGLGDPAPKIAVKSFIKGEPVKEFKKGKLYVVEFWATWCGPCRESIPHLTELAKKHRDVTFVGVSVFEQSQAGVKPFVTQMGNKMNYHVAMDMVPAGAQGGDGKMATSWMKAASQDGIPTAFIVDKTSRIAWIGHPMEMEKPLDDIIAGKWDVRTAKAKMDKQQAAQKKMRELGMKFQQAGKDPEKQLAVLDAAIADDATLETNLASLKLNLLMKSQPDSDTTADYVSHLTDTVYKDNMQGLNSVAWTMIDPDQPKRSAKLCAAALKAAQRADELANSKDAAIADTLARAYFCNDDVAKAVETQTRAVELAKGTALEKDADLPKRLEEYKKAASSEKQ